MPDVLRVVLDAADDVAHLRQHFGLFLVVDVALQELEHVQPVSGIANERGEQDVEAVVDRDEVGPVPGPAPQGRFVGADRLAAQIPGLERCKNVLAGEARAVEPDAHAGGKDRIDEAARIANHQPAVAGNLGHGVAVVALPQQPEKGQSPIPYGIERRETGTVPRSSRAARAAPPTRRTHAQPHKSQTLRLRMGLYQQLPPGFSTLESQRPDAQAAHAARGLPPCVSQYLENRVAILASGYRRNDGVRLRRDLPAAVIASTCGVQRLFSRKTRHIHLRCSFRGRGSCEVGPRVSRDPLGEIHRCRIPATPDGQIGNGRWVTRIDSPLLPARRCGSTSRLSSEPPGVDGNTWEPPRRAIRNRQRRIWIVHDDAGIAGLAHASKLTAIERSQAEAVALVACDCRETTCSRRTLPCQTCDCPGRGSRRPRRGRSASSTSRGTAHPRCKTKLRRRILVAPLY